MIIFVVLQLLSDFYLPSEFESIITTLLDNQPVMYCMKQILVFMYVLIDVFLYFCMLRKVSRKWLYALWQLEVYENVHCKWPNGCVRLQINRFDLMY